MSQLPDLDRLSVLVATILLALAGARFINLPGRDLGVQLPGLYLGLQINTNTAIALLVAGLTASGTYWLLESHPAFDPRRVAEAMLLPALTAMVTGVVLNNLPPAPIWWLVFSGGGMILVLVLIAEYIAVDAEDARQPLAGGLLIAISFALFLTLAISLRTIEIRLLFLLPSIAIAAGLVALRAIRLRVQGQWWLPQTTAVALLAAQLAAAFHYLPLSPPVFGLFLLGPTYAMTILVINLVRGSGLSQAIAEPLVVLLIVIGLAVWVR